MTSSQEIQLKFGGVKTKIDNIKLISKRINFQIKDFCL